MLAVLQRVSRAGVRVGADYEATIGEGILILLGVARGDDEEDARWLAEKCSTLRIFLDDQGRMNRGLDEVRGAALVVSQFTLFGDCEKGRRPSFSRAADPATAERLYELFARELAGRGVPVERGVFGAMMQVSLVNEGPVTLIVDSAEWKGRRNGRAGAKDGAS
jgi:D-tyrosyl-tRNA(Tyr) deacylase